jgi:hypothetical protein
LSGRGREFIIMASRVAEIVRRENDVGWPPPQSRGDTYLMDLSMIKTLLQPFKTLEHELRDTIDFLSICLKEGKPAATIRLELLARGFEEKPAKPCAGRV